MKDNVKDKIGSDQFKAWNKYALSQRDDNKINFVV